MLYFRRFFDQPNSAPWPDTAKIAREFFAVLTPHIDFRVSSSSYSYAFSPLLQATPAEVYVILGVGHHAHQDWSIDGRDYLTPLGTVKIETPLATKLMDQVDFSLGDHSAHEGEHSIEFALVLLQALRKLRGIEKPFTFLPVLCGGLFDAVELGEAPPPLAPLYRLANALEKLLQEYGERVQLIVSIDGCHIGPRFGHQAVTSEQLTLTAQWEEILWGFVEKSDLKGFFSHLGQDGNARYFDGVGALSLFMAMYRQGFQLTRTHYEQWFEPRDSSAVTFTSGHFIKK